MKPLEVKGIDGVEDKGALPLHYVIFLGSLLLLSLLFQQVLVEDSASPALRWWVKWCGAASLRSWNCSAGGAGSTTSFPNGVLPLTAFCKRQLCEICGCICWDMVISVSSIVYCQHLARGLSLGSRMRQSQSPLPFCAFFSTLLVAPIAGVPWA